MMEENWMAVGLDADILNVDPIAARRTVDAAIQRRKIISTHYQHVDGTSFAAPITASVVALMLEANPKLTPSAIKNILISTASRLGGRPATRQGFGILNAPAAIRLAKVESHALEPDRFHPPRVVGQEILFSYHDDTATKISLVGDFNNWDRSANAFERCSDGLWAISLSCLPAGKLSLQASDR